jgi:hypothetical protein
MLDALKTLPIEYAGSLHDVELVQFSLDPGEAARELPPGLAPRLVNGRAVVSTVHVRLAGMHPIFMPPPFRFGYRHIALRLLVDDGPLNGDGTARGIFFVRSFTDRPLLARAGSLLTHYRLSPARIRVEDGEVAVRQEGRHIAWTRRASDEPGSPGLFGSWEEARSVLCSLDRAYAVDPRGRTWRTRILRPDWPIEPLGLAGFSTDFFATARFECAFQVRETIPYRWLPPARVA